jgi:hypothetical protein
MEFTLKIKEKMFYVTGDKSYWDTHIVANIVGMMTDGLEN